MKRSIKWPAVIILVFLSCLISTESAKCSQTDEVTAFSYGMRLYNEGHYDMAAMQFRVFVNQYPESPNREEAYFLIGNSHFRQQDYKNAADAFLEYLLRFQSGKRAPVAQFSLGRCLEKQNDFKGAVEAWSRLALVYPQSTEKYNAMANKSRLLISMKKYAEAELTLRTLRDQSGGTIKFSALCELAKLYMSQKKFRAADTAVQNMFGIASDPKQKSQTLIILTGLYRKTGQFGRIIEQLTQYLQETEDPPLSAELWLGLGRAHTCLQNSARADEAYLKSLSLANDTGTAYCAAYEAGKLALDTKSFQQAAAMLEKAFSAADDAVKKADAALLLSGALISMGQYARAAEICESVLKQDAIKLEQRKKLMLCAASAYRKSGNFQKASFLYGKYAELYQSDELVPDVLIADGTIHSCHFHDYDTAALYFRSVLKNGAGQKLYPRALYLLGRTMERTGRHTEAAEVFSRLCREFRTSSWSDSARTRLSVMHTLSPEEYRNAFIQVNAGMAQLVEGAGKKKDMLLLLADISYKKLKDYKSAAGYLRKCLLYTRDEQERDSILVRIGESYRNAYRIRKNPIYADSAVSVLSQVIARGNITCEAMSVLAELQESAEPDTAVFTYREYLRNCPDAPKKARAFYYLGTSFQHNAPDTAVAFFTKAVETAENTIFYRRSLFQLVQEYYKKNDVAAADSLVEMYEKASGPGPRSAYMKAMLCILSADIEGALSELGRLQQKWAWSSWADSAGMHQLDLLMEKGKYEETLELCASLLHADSISCVSYMAGFVHSRKQQKFRNEILVIQGRAYEALENMEKARKSYRKIDISTNTKYRIHYYEAMARLAEKGHNTDESEYLLKELFRENDSYTTAAQLGRMYSSTGKYAEAETWLLKSLELQPGPENSIILERDLVVSMIKQGKIPQANVRITMFSSKWEKHTMYETCMARFFLEKGKAYIEKKDFEDALDQLDIIKKKYRKTMHYAESEMQKGRVLLITNKIEDALQLLTRMTQEYQHDPVIHKVYLNLGDYYFRSQQYNIALEAFSKARKDTSDNSVSMVATRYLIRVHDMLRMYDSGLVLTREYIDSFPFAEDIIQKKIQIGTFLMKLHEYTRAIEQLKRVKEIADSETQAEIQYWIGTCFNSMGNFRQAIFEFLQVKYLLPSTKLPWAATALYEAGQCYLKLDEPEKARNIFNKIVIQEGASSDLGRIAKKRIEEIKERQKRDAEPGV